MESTSLHRFVQGERRFVVDAETCFCFECDEVSWAVLEHYPQTPVNRILHLLRENHPVREVEEVIGELEWLRSTKSILPSTNPKDRLKHFELSRELQDVDLRLPTFQGGAEALLSGALALLLGRSGARKDISLRMHCASAHLQPEALVTLVERAFRNARLAGKSLTLEILLPIAESRDLASHQVFAALSLTSAEGASALVPALLKAARGNLSKLSAQADGVTGASIGVVLVPGNAAFSDAIAHLSAQGFKRIDLDLPAAYQITPTLEPAAMLHGMQTTAVYYARQLAQGNYFRLEPIASTFRQIYEGKAEARSDGSGTQSLAIDEHGVVYPSRYFFGQSAFAMGNVAEGNLDEAVRGPFDDLGAHTTPGCIRCWARNLCGGGHSAIHHALGGAIRKPNALWCESQRDWFAAAIAAFNLLSAQGVNFARLYQNLQPRKKLSLWQAARTAMVMKVGVRPIEEGDAPLLTRWENWSDATYFLGNEYGMFLATNYDREMDSLHPRGIEQELMIVSRRNEPLGLLKLRPEQRLGVARVWFFLKDPSGYSDSALRKSFGHILSEAAGQAAFSTLIAAAGPGDPGLGDFLKALGFQHAGTERQALYLHDNYHDIDVFTLKM
jgi:uncharacterized protein